MKKKKEKCFVALGMPDREDLPYIKNRVSILKISY